MTSLGQLVIVISMACSIVTGLILTLRNRSPAAIFIGTVGTAVIVFFVLFFLLS
jgi:hypothetical protein